MITDSTSATSSSNSFDTGFGFANMALGVYTSYTQASQYATGCYRYTNAEWYVQDTWKVNRRLTLDYGLRFQWIQPQFDAAEQTSTFLPERFDLAKAPRLYYPTGTPSNRRALDRATGQTFDGTYIGKIVNGTGNLLDGIAQAGEDVSKGHTGRRPGMVCPEQRSPFTSTHRPGVT
jgi:hypothetical protein